MSQAERSGAESRSEEILDSIVGTFARKGFDGASMQDLASAAGMSVGNFYRYFPSKLAIVEAFVGRCTRDVQRDFRAVRDEPDFLAAFRRLIEMNRDSMVDEEAAIWVHVDAAATRHPEIRRLKEAMEASIRADVFTLLQRAAPVTDPEAAKRLEELADFMVVLAGGLFRRFAFGDRASERERFDALTTFVVETARDRLAAIHAPFVLPEAAE